MREKGLFVIQEKFWWISALRIESLSHKNTILKSFNLHPTFHDHLSELNPNLYNSINQWIFGFYYIYKLSFLQSHIYISCIFLKVPFYCLSRLCTQYNTIHLWDKCHYWTRMRGRIMLMLSKNYFIFKEFQGLFWKTLKKWYWTIEEYKKCLPRLI